MAVAADPRIGTELAGYRIETLLGRGGMGAVYLAEQLRLKRRVALKLLTPELAADERFRERFLRESELAASIDHPNVLPVFDAGEVDGRLYIAMRYVEGTDLRKLLADDGRLDPERAVTIVGAVAAGLDAAHARGLVHRDVKPANVLLAKDGHVYLADFGLTRSAGEGSPEEKPHLSGTLGYVAPEQIDGELPDPSADIYSLGCVLFECLAGQPPFPGSSPVGLLFAHLEKPPPSLHQQRPELPAAVDPVIGTALAKDPAERYRSCQELCDAAGEALGLRWLAKAREWDERRRERSLLLRGNELKAAETYLDGVGAGADPTLTALQREYVSASRSAISRRQRLTVAASLAVAALAIVSLVFALISRSQATSEARRADASATQAQTAAEEAKAAETAQLAQRLGAQALVEEDLDRSLLLARQAVAIHDSPQTRAYLLSALEQSPAAIGVMQAGGDAYSIALSSDGRRLAVENFRGAVSVFDARSLEQLGDPLWLTNGPGGIALSPDGRTLAAAGNDRNGTGYLELRDLGTWRLGRNLHFRFPFADAQARYHLDSVAYSPDGSLIATAQPQALPDGSPGNWLLVLRDPSTGKPTGRPFVTGAGPLAFAFTPDGRSVLTSNRGPRGDLTQWDIQSRQRVRTFERLPGMLIVSLSVSPDGETVAIGRTDGSIDLVDLDSGQKRTVSGRHSAALNTELFSPDGKTLATTSEDGTAMLWDAESGVLRETLSGHTASVEGAVFSPDGNTLYTVSQDARAMAWDLRRDRRLGQSLASGPPLGAGQLSSDGRLIAVALEKDGIGLWDAAALRRVGLLSTGGPVAGLDFAPDGKQLVALGWDGNATVWDLDSRSLARGPWEVTGTRGFGRNQLGGEIPPVVRVSPDGTTVAVAGRWGTTLWDVATGISLGRLVGGPASAGGAVDVAFDSRGERLALARGDGTHWVPGNAEVWDVASRTRLASVAPDIYGLFTVALSPDGNMLATAGRIPVISLWDVQTGEKIRDLPQGDQGSLARLEFSPDGSTLAASGYTAIVTLWDVASGARIGKLEDRAEGYSAIAFYTGADFSPDGKRLLMTVQDGRGLVWDVDPESWKRRACDIANRTLTQEEWDQFLPGRPYEPACAST
jgi:serine/threonine protein kinase/WD40 repeat protein